MEAWMRNLFLCIAGALLLASTVTAGEKKLMHCFAFTSKQGASQADWDAFYKATDELPKKIKGLSKVWYGKLDWAGGQPARDFGVCMEMASPAVREAYGSDPAHDEWNKAYQKVYTPGTTTFDMHGQ